MQISNEHILQNLALVSKPFSILFNGFERIHYRRHVFYKAVVRCRLGHQNARLYYHLREN